MIIILIFFSFPIYWIVASSLKHRADMFRIPPEWIFSPIITHYAEVFTNPEIQRAILNSLIIAVGNTALTLFLAIFTAYSLARFDFKMKNIISLSFLSLRMLPPIAMVVPLFLLSRNIGLYDTHIAVILATNIFTLPYAIWILKGFFESLPRELEESALIDGCSRVQAIYKIVIPLSLPGILVAGIFSFIFAWNQFQYPLILTDRFAQPMPVVIASFLLPTGHIYWGQMFATATTLAFPTIIFGLLVRKYFVTGITLGAID